LDKFIFDLPLQTLASSNNQVWIDINRFSE